MNAKIYALINTVTDAVFYIGCTVQPLKVRLSSHLSYPIKCPKNDYIYDILIAGGKVEILELDEVDFETGSFWEQHYIDLFFSFGYNLIQKRKSNYNECKPQNRARGRAFWNQ